MQWHGAAALLLAALPVMCAPLHQLLSSLWGQGRRKAGTRKSEGHALAPYKEKDSDDAIAHGIGSASATAAAPAPPPGRRPPAGCYTAVPLPGIVVRYDPRIVKISEAPLIVLQDDFFSPAECDALVDLAAPHMERSFVSGRTHSPNRTSASAFFTGKSPRAPAK
jgi:hypothetical protein